MSARWPVLASLLALSVAPDGSTTGDLAAKVRALTGQAHQDHTVRQASYDLRKLRGKRLAVKPGEPAAIASRGRRPHHRRTTHPARPGGRHVVAHARAAPLAE